MPGLIARITSLGKFSISLLMLLALASCETATAINVKGFPPEISFSGSGAMAQLVVTGPFSADEMKAGHLNSTDLRLLWQINPGGVYDNTNMSRLPPIIYGIVPQGCRQVYPPSGSPKPLVEGSYYGISVPTRGAPDISVIFKIENGRAVKVPTSGS